MDPKFQSKVKLNLMLEILLIQIFQAKNLKQNTKTQHWHNETQDFRLK